MIIINCISIKDGGGVQVMKVLLEPVLRKKIKNITFLVDFELKDFPKIENVKVFKGNVFFKYIALIFFLRKLEKKNNFKVLTINSFPLIFIKSYQYVIFQNRNLIPKLMVIFHFKSILRFIFLKLLIFLSNKNKMTIIYNLSNILPFLKEVWGNINFLQMSLVEGKIKNKFSKKLNKFIDYKIKKTFISISSDNHNKNNEILYKAWPYIIKKFPNCKLLEVGVQKENYFKNSLENFKSYGYLSNTKTIQLLKESDVLIFTSLSESLGFPLLEAKNENKIVIAPDLDYVWDILIPDFVFNPKSFKSLIRSVLLFLGDDLDIDPKFKDGKEVLEYIKNTN